MIPFSVLDLSPVPEGQTPADALRNTLDLAQKVESWGYNRFWLAEHHNMTGIASAATAVVMAHVAAGTKTIRVGSGGVMLPNHSPLVIAEQFGTLASLHPGRIDLGLGRAPGTDQPTARALRRDAANTAENFPQDVQELQSYFAPATPGQRVRAVPGAGLEVPIWLLGSSLFSAQLAALLGLPFAFASHFAPDALLQALDIYRSRFQPSKQLDRPYTMIGVNVLAADTADEARYQFTTVQQSFTNLVRGKPGEVPAPIDDIETYWTPTEKLHVQHMLQYAMVGTVQTVQRGLQALVDSTGVDELMLTTHIYDHQARLRSFELAGQISPRLERPQHGHTSEMNLHQISQ